MYNALSDSLSVLMGHLFCCREQEEEGGEAIERPAILASPLPPLMQACTQELMVNTLHDRHSLAT